MVVVMSTGYGSSNANQLFFIYFTYDIQDRDFTFNTACPEMTNLPHPPIVFPHPAIHSQHIFQKYPDFLQLSICTGNK